MQVVTLSNRRPASATELCQLCAIRRILYDNWPSALNFVWGHVMIRLYLYLWFAETCAHRGVARLLLTFRFHKSGPVLSCQNWLKKLFKAPLFHHSSAVNMSEANHLISQADLRNVIPMPLTQCWESCNVPHVMHGKPYY